MKFIVDEMPEFWYECPFCSRKRQGEEFCSCGNIILDCEYFKNGCNPEYCNWLKESNDD